ncbi:AAA family ATPase [Planomicrobium sp. CPCC 101079]|uniref:AAA family ATPase n=1 Tax=Planomicrobium sp. CPCC 101079 TaxID=2599618 RepID=UPI0011B3B5B4|nr:AAA family ATPase [Planomicrobium sp. CPCC 101079]TWT01888.1 AAA family ATPase [Planomicrobium sp. CPCC 101079]
MKFVLLFGPQAVGKMTVGHELEKLTDLKLFHNHMTIDLVHPFFGFNAETWRLSDMFREEIFKAVAQSDLEGMIFTYVWAFDSKKDWDFVRKTRAIFESAGGEVFLVELEAETSERLQRNRTPHRLEHKPTKRNLEESELHLIETLEKNRLNSLPDEIQEENYIRIDNTCLDALTVAKQIKDRFAL